MGPQLQYLETVLTCKGNFYAPDFKTHLDDFKCRLQQLIAKDTSSKLVVKKVEPWNSVRVTFNMPIEAARRLKELAERRDVILHDLGILAVQIEGGRIISLTIDNKTSEPTELVVNTSSRTVSAGSDLVSSASQATSSSLPECVIPSSDDFLKSMTQYVQVPNNKSAVEHQLNNLVGAISNSSGPSGVQNLTMPVQNVGSHPSVVANSQQASYDFLPFRSVAYGMSPFDNLVRADGFQSRMPMIAGNVPAQLPQPQLSSSLGFHPGNQPGIRCWQQQLQQQVDERIPANQNIASSSPLLVNLLKSPGSRGQQQQQQQQQLALQQPPNNPVMMTYPPSSELYTSIILSTPKRRRSQARKSKRLKEESEGSLMANASIMSVGCPTTGNTFNPLLQAPMHVTSCPSNMFHLPAASSVGGSSEQLSYRNVGGSMERPPYRNLHPPVQNNSKVCRQMINPYTGDLEVVEELEDENDVSANYDASSASAASRCNLLPVKNEQSSVSVVNSCMPDRPVNISGIVSQLQSFPGIAVSQSSSTIGQSRAGKCSQDFNLNQPALVTAGSWQPSSSHMMPMSVALSSISASMQNPEGMRSYSSDILMPKGLADLFSKGLRFLPPPGFEKKWFASPNLLDSQADKACSSSQQEPVKLSLPYSVPLLSTGSNLLHPTSHANWPFSDTLNRNTTGGDIFGLQTSAPASLSCGSTSRNVDSSMFAGLPAGYSASFAKNILRLQTGGGDILNAVAMPVAQTTKQDSTPSYQESNIISGKMSTENLHLDKPDIEISNTKSSGSLGLGNFNSNMAPCTSMHVLPELNSSLISSTLDGNLGRHSNQDNLLVSIEGGATKLKNISTEANPDVTPFATSNLGGQNGRIPLSEALKLAESLVIDEALKFSSFDDSNQQAVDCQSTTTRGSFVSSLNDSSVAKVKLTTSSEFDLEMCQLQSKTSFPLNVQQTFHVVATQNVPAPLKEITTEQSSKGITLDLIRNKQSSVYSQLSDVFANGSQSSMSNSLQSPISHNSTSTEQSGICHASFSRFEASRSVGNFDTKESNSIDGKLANCRSSSSSALDSTTFLISADMIKREDCNGYLSDRLPESSVPWNCNCLPSSDGVDTRTFDHGASSSLNLDTKPSISCPLTIYSSFHASKQAVVGVSREIHRKAVRNIEEFMPRTKTNLTVAQLLEQAENAKMNRVSPCRSLAAMPKIDSPSEMVTRETISLPDAMPVPTIRTSSCAALSSAEVLMTRAVTAPVLSCRNVSSHSVNSQQAKASSSYPTSNLHPFSVLDSLPLPITSPGYPHNLTESVQKVMQGVGLDTSPPPSPKHICTMSSSTKQHHALQQPRTRDGSFGAAGQLISSRKMLEQTLKISTSSVSDALQEGNVKSHIDTTVHDSDYVDKHSGSLPSDPCTYKIENSDQHRLHAADLFNPDCSISKGAGGDSVSNINLTTSTELDLALAPESLQKTTDAPLEADHSYSVEMLQRDEHNEPDKFELMADESHIDSIIALKDYDEDIELLAGTLASDINCDLDEELLTGDELISSETAENETGVSACENTPMQTLDESSAIEDVSKPSDNVEPVDNCSKDANPTLDIPSAPSLEIGNGDDIGNGKHSSLETDVGTTEIHPSEDIPNISEPLLDSQVSENQESDESTKTREDSNSLFLQTSAFLEKTSTDVDCETVVATNQQLEVRDNTVFEDQSGEHEMETSNAKRKIRRKNAIGKRETSFVSSKNSSIPESAPIITKDCIMEEPVMLPLAVDQPPVASIQPSMATRMATRSSGRTKSISVAPSGSDNMNTDETVLHRKDVNSDVVTSRSMENTRWVLDEVQSTPRRSTRTVRKSEQVDTVKLQSKLQKRDSTKSEWDPVQTGDVGKLARLELDPSPVGDAEIVGKSSELIENKKASRLRPHQKQSLTKTPRTRKNRSRGGAGKNVSKGFPDNDLLDEATISDILPSPPNTDKEISSGVESLNDVAKHEDDAGVVSKRQKVV